MKALCGNKILRDGYISQGCILVDDTGRIKEVLPALPSGFDGVVEDQGDLLVMPGLCDTHVHINEPGRTDWEGFLTATRAAAAGGVTTVVDMPLNCIPVTTSLQALEEKLKSVAGKLWVDTGFWGGVTPKSLGDLPKLLKSGVLGVKSFLIDSGIEEFPPMNQEDLEKAMPLLAEADIPYLFHAELPGPQPAPEARDTYSSFLNSRPRSWENHAIDLIIQLTQKFGGKSHIVHLSSSDALNMIQEAKGEGLRITAETCPHYLVLNSEAIEEKNAQAGNTIFKCCPPIREKHNQDLLWQGLKDGILDFVVSDHSPCTPSLKHLEKNDFAQAWGGISGLQFTLPLLWTHGKKHFVDEIELSHWLSLKPAQMAGLSHKKGKIAKNYDADLVVWDPSEPVKIEKTTTLHRHKESPYTGWSLQGRIHRTYLRGEKIFENGKVAAKPLGQTLLRT